MTEEEVSLSSGDDNEKLVWGAASSSTSASCSSLNGSGGSDALNMAAKGDVSVGLDRLR